MAIVSEVYDSLKTHAFCKNLILTGKSKGRDTIIEKKDGEYLLVNKAYIFSTPDVVIENIERITIIKDGKEIEFVSTL